MQSNRSNNMMMSTLADDERGILLEIVYIFVLQVVKNYNFVQNLFILSLFFLQIFQQVKGS
jgi:hypothetical protein